MSGLQLAPFLLLPLLIHAQDGATAKFVFTEIDEKLLEQAEMLDQQFEKKGLVFNDPSLDPYLEAMVKPILQSAGTPERVRWKFRVLRDSSVNAFALPNGSVYVHTGLLSILENDAQLAGVLAHEVTHVTQRHAYEQYRSYRKKMVGLHVLSAASSYTPLGTSWGSAIRIISEGASAALILSIFGYSRALEREADIFAVDRIAACGYDPLQVSKTFELLDEKLEVEPVVTFYRDHPKLSERVKYTTAMAKAKPAATIAPSSSQPYLAIVQRAVQYNIQADIDSRRFRTAAARAQRLFDFHPEDARNTLLLAEAYREMGPRTARPQDKELTMNGKADARWRFSKQTLAEEDRVLLARPHGADTQRSNWNRAEELYKRVLSADPSSAAAYRGLGFLYEDEGKKDQAAGAYRKYLELAPEAADRSRIQRRLNGIEVVPKDQERAR